MPRAERLQPDWLLCERCGYRLDGLPHDAPCPECGTPIGESLPARRVGSAWQRKPGLVEWVATNWTTVRHPWTRWDEVRVAPSEMLSLNVTFIAILVGIVFAAVTGPPVDESGATESWTALLGGIFIALMFTLFVWVPLFLLTHIEGLGLRVLGARNKWRITKEISGAILAHASIGWLLGVPVLVLEIVILNSGGRSPAARWMTGSPVGFLIMLAAAPLAGLLGFELLAWLGWRRMKFANRTPRNPIEGV